MKRFFFKLWVAYLAPVLWNWIPAWIQALWNIRGRSAGRKVLAELYLCGGDTSAIASALREYGFEWSSDPWGGLLDYHSIPWVTALRRGGDCDDFAHLWRYVLRPHGETWLMFTQKHGGSAHAMVVYRKKGAGLYELLSNTQVLHRSTEVDDLMDRFYGKDTELSFLYGGTS